MREHIMPSTQAPPSGGLVLYTLDLLSAPRCSSLQALLQLVELILHFPHLLVGQRLLLLPLLELLLDVLDLLLLVFVAERDILLHIDLVARPIVNLIRPRVAISLLVVSCHRLALNAQIALLPM